MIESRNLADLLPIVTGHAIAAIAAAEMQTQLKIIVVATFRDDEMQAKYYSQGRGGNPGRIITNDPGPGGPHSLRVALDIAPAIKRPDTGKYVLYYETTDWELIADCFKLEGFIWGGDWKIKDKPHFQWTKYQSLAEIRNGAEVYDPND